MNSMKATLFKAILKLKWLFTCILALLLVRTFLSALDPYLTKIIVDNLVIGAPYVYIAMFIAIYIAAYVVRLIIELPAAYLETKLTTRFSYELRQSILFRLFHMDYLKFRRFHSGDLLSRIEHDVAQLEGFTCKTLVNALMNVVWLLTAVTIMLRIDWKATVIFGALIPIIPFLFKLTLPKVQLLSAKVKKLRSATMSLLTESINGMHVLRMSNYYNFMDKRYKKLAHQYIGNSSRLAVVRGVAPVLSESVSTLVTPGLVFFYCAYRILQGDLSVGDMLAFYGYTSRLIVPLVALTHVGVSWKEAAVSLTRLQQLFDISLDQGSVISNDTTPAIVFENVTFGYGEDDLFENLSLEIKHGEKVVVSGQSGVGKSTVANLITGLLRPSHGKIKVAGIDTVDWDKQSLREMITYVPQESFLINNTVYDNVVFGLSHVSEEEVVCALKAACAWDFVSRLPNGLREEILEGGRSLSGGQQQRIGLARALLRFKQILILDEATSAIDTHTEAEIVNNIMSLDGTVIIISHNPMVSKYVDKVVLLKGGENIEISEASN